MPKYIEVIANGKVYILRIGAVCKNCKSDLTIENWAMGYGNICKSCINEYQKARGDNKRRCLYE